MRGKFRPTALELPQGRAPYNRKIKGLTGHMWDIITSSLTYRYIKR